MCFVLAVSDYLHSGKHHSWMYVCWWFRLHIRITLKGDQMTNVSINSASDSGNVLFWTVRFVTKQFCFNRCVQFRAWYCAWFILPLNQGTHFTNDFSISFEIWEIEIGLRTDLTWATIEQDLFRHMPYSGITWFDHWSQSIAVDCHPPDVVRPTCNITWEEFMTVAWSWALCQMILSGLSECCQWKMWSSRVDQSSCTYIPKV